MTTAPSAVGSGRQRQLLAQAQAAAAALRELSPDAPVDQVLSSLAGLLINPSFALSHT